MPYLDLEVSTRSATVQARVRQHPIAPNVHIVPADRLGIGGECNHSPIKLGLCSRASSQRAVPGLP